MKKYSLLLLTLFSCSVLDAAQIKNYDYDFQQERMLTAEDGIYLISSFETKDGITAYSYYGEKLWEVFFHAKITSWQVVGDRVFIFSKDRGGSTTYLTCLDRFTGRRLWERP
jgi:hypothetical protein